MKIRLTSKERRRILPILGQLQRRGFVKGYAFREETPYWEALTEIVGKEIVAQIHAAKERGESTHYIPVVRLEPHPRLVPNDWKEPTSL